MTLARLRLTGLAVAALITAFVLVRPSAPDHRPEASRPDVSARQITRAWELHSQAPHLTEPEVEELLTASDRVREQLAEQGVPDVGDEVRRRLREASTTSEARRDYYEDHRALFGRRSFAQSETTIDQLLRIEQVRAELGIAPR